MLLVAKMVDDLLMTGEQSQVEIFIFKFNQCFCFGTVSPGPGKPRFYGLGIIPDGDMPCSENADDKLP